MVGSAGGAHNTSSLQLLSRHLHFVLFHWVFKMIKELWVWPWCQVSCHSWNRDLQGLPPNLRNDILGLFWGQGRWRGEGAHASHHPYKLPGPSSHTPPSSPSRGHLSLQPGCSVAGLWRTPGDSPVALPLSQCFSCHSSSRVTSTRAMDSKSCAGLACCGSDALLFLEVLGEGWFWSLVKRRRTLVMSHSDVVVFVRL